MRDALIALALVLAAPGVDLASAQSLDAARQYYDEALAERDAGRRMALLERSFEERETYEAAIALGEEWLQQREPVQARAWLDKAHALCRPGEPCARALFRIGETYLLEDQHSRYAQYLKQSLAHHRTPSVERAFRKLLENRQVRMVPADQIVMALTPDDTMRSATVPTAIDLPLIRFEFDSARLTPAGRDQVRELGVAMQSRRADILLVGHTDEQGTRRYNAGLSMRRAEEVRRFLVDEFGLDARNIAVQGRGEDEPLIEGQTETVHAMNRRVEVVGHD